jgi:hypothetical protein
VGTFFTVSPSFIRFLIACDLVLLLLALAVSRG